MVLGGVITVLADYQLFRRCYTAHSALAPLVPPAKAVYQQQQDFKRRHRAILRCSDKFWQNIDLLFRLLTAAIFLGILLMFVVTMVTAPGTTNKCGVAIIVVMTGIVASSELIALASYAYYCAVRKRQDTMIHAATATVDQTVTALQRVYPRCWVYNASRAHAPQYYVCATADAPAITAGRMLHAGTQYLILAADGTSRTSLDLQGGDGIACYQTTPNDCRVRTCLRRFAMRAMNLISDN